MTACISQILHLACATCMNDRNGVTQKAANLGIWMMLGALVLVFSCFGLVVLNFARRARQARLSPQ